MSALNPLFDPRHGIAGWWSIFLALLELAREKLIRITQTEAFQPIYVKVHKVEPTTVKKSA